MHRRTRPISLDSDVSSQHVVELELPALGDGDPYRLAVDGSGSSLGRFGGFGAIDDSGRATAGWFYCNKELVNRYPALTARPQVAEMHALRMGLRRYRNGDTVHAVVDSLEVAALMEWVLHQEPAGEYVRGYFPKAARELASHARRLRLSVSLDPKPVKKRHVSDDPLMLRAHRLSVGMRALLEVKAPFDDDARAWLEMFALSSSRDVVVIKNQHKNRLAWLERWKA